MARARTLLVAVVSAGIFSAPAAAQDVAGLDGVGHLLGSPDAPIHIIEFADYACGFCAQFSRETMPALRRDWIESGRASLRFIGFHNSYFKPGRNGARAAECAADQGAFWPMHDRIYAAQREWLSRRGNRERFEEWAGELGLDVVAFRACWEENPADDRLDHNTDLASDRGVRATPTFFIAGKRVEGALTFEQFSALLEEAARAATDPGHPARPFSVPLDRAARASSDPARPVR